MRISDEIISIINIVLKGLFVLAEALGKKPHIFLESILKQGAAENFWSFFTRKRFSDVAKCFMTSFIFAGPSELIRIYAGCMRGKAVYSIQILESNHNVSVLLKKSPSMMLNPFQPEIVRMHLLHPDDPSRNKELCLSTRGLNVNQEVVIENFITSKQLDEYCHGGKYYISC